MMVARKTDCFGWANAHVADYGPRALVVHGDVNIDGERLPHAWVEAGQMVYDVQNRAITTDVFYSNADPRGVLRYSQLEAATLQARTGHHGPWTREERGLLKKRRNNPRGGGYKFSGTEEILDVIREADPDDADPDYLPDHEAIVAKARRYPSSFHRERHVTWIGTKGYLVRIPVENICFMEGNQWYPAHAAALLRQIESGENYYFEVPAGRIYRVSAKDVAQSEKYEAEGELEDQLGMVEPWTKADVGSYWAQLLDGNHRAAAAMLAGDAYVDVYIGENYKDNVLKKDRI